MWENNKAILNAPACGLDLGSPRGRWPRCSYEFRKDITQILPLSCHQKNITISQTELQYEITMSLAAADFHLGIPKLEYSNSLQLNTLETPKCRKLIKATLNAPAWGLGFKAVREGLTNMQQCLSWRNYLTFFHSPVTRRKSQSRKQNRNTNYYELDIRKLPSRISLRSSPRLRWLRESTNTFLIKN